jgi:hypothetical protein
VGRIALRIKSAGRGHGIVVETISIKGEKLREAAENTEDTFA